MGKKRSRRKQATKGWDEETSTNNNKISEEMKAGEGPTVCLFVENSPPENSSLYVIRLPLDLSELEEYQDMFDVYDSKQNITIISPFLEECTFLHDTACINLGSKFYFFGGNNSYTPPKLDDPLSLRVQVIDINDPQPQLRSVKSMHTPKDRPCVFVADGMIYALAPPPPHHTTMLPGCQHTGFFERYIPFTDSWQVLPDPPLFLSWAGADLLDCATVIGRHVIIGCPFLDTIFNLDSLTWYSTQPTPRPAPYFPYGSVFLQQSASLYRLTGLGVPRATHFLFARGPDTELVTAVRRFPLPANDKLMVHDIYGEGQIMAEAKDLDENKSFTNLGFYPKRFFFHVGGRFFCYVVTAQLFDQNFRTQEEVCSRAVFIKFFQDVPAPITANSKGGSSKTVFRTVASFCYKIDTTFPNFTNTTRCSVIGTVPDSWINSPPKKKQESKLKSVNKEMDSITHDLSRVMRSEREKCVVGRHELEKTENGDRGTEELKKLLAAREAEISLLKAKLAMKEGAGSTSF